MTLPNRVILWQPTDHAEAVAAGLIDVDAETYASRLIVAEDEAHQQGVPEVVTLVASVGDVLAACEEHGLDASKPDERAAVFAIMFLA